MATLFDAIIIILNVADAYLKLQEPNIACFAFKPKLGPDVVVSESCITIDECFSEQKIMKDETEEESLGRTIDRQTDRQTVCIYVNLISV